MRVSEGVFAKTGNIAYIQGIPAKQIVKLLQSGSGIKGLFLLTDQACQDKKHGSVADNHIAAPYKVFWQHGKPITGFFLDGKKPVCFCQNRVPVAFLQAAGMMLGICQDTQGSKSGNVCPAKIGLCKGSA